MRRLENGSPGLELTRDFLEVCLHVSNCLSRAMPHNTRIRARTAGL